MVDDTAVPETPDIVQLIAAALQSESTSRAEYLECVNDDTETVIGHVPEHLRSLCDLCNELLVKERAMEEELMISYLRSEAIRTLLIESIFEKLPDNVREQYDSVGIRVDWHVIGQRSEENK